MRLLTARPGVARDKPTKTDPSRTQVSLQLLLFLVVSVPIADLLAVPRTPAPSLRQSSRGQTGNTGSSSWSEEEVKKFLAMADVVDMETIPEGITGAQKVTLEKEGQRLQAVFRTVDVRKRRWESPATSNNLSDYHLHECAAYELSRLLGLDVVPPAVPRQIGKEKGTIQAWVEGAMMEKERSARNLTPPDRESWTLQRQVLEIFDNLVYNSDRNTGNILIDANWKIWLIDHTRAFRTFSQLPHPKNILTCEKTLWDNLKNLDRKTLKGKLSPYLSGNQLSSLEKRRRLLVETIEALIEKHGEAEVILVWP